MFVPLKLFQPSKMLVGEARAYTSEALFRCSALGLAPGLTHKHWTILEKPARDKHSSLLRAFVNYGLKKFYNTGPKVQSFKTFYSINCLLIAIS